MDKSTSISELSNMISIYSDIDEVNIDGEIYNGVMSRPRKELSQWLYCVLHAGNPKLLNNNYAENNDLEKTIDSILPNINISTPVRSIKFHDREFAEVNGVRVESNIKNRSVELPSKRPHLTPGFFMFIATNEIGKYRHYIGVDNPEDAIRIWTKSIDTLLSLNVSFSTKLLSQRNSYPRNDAIVFYSNKDSKIVEKVLISMVEDIPISSKGIHGSPFTMPISNTLTYGEQPVDKKGIRQSLGEQRTELIALAIRDSFTTGINFNDLLAQRFKLANINLQNIAKNWIEGIV
ncbi:T3SS effector HopA1 family protein [Bombilactobacillus thymidiniphilus]|uniref:T3SS effector HopA1 family protein n=1 Tax=Bombilactobacillus thymidiniphilus TaxID=2923363 RepID=A0ABY4PEG9_9LACO|nr:T3SS effector HopA1 family protein [Bombilactobacillus thymidiniphilus]UQS84131.1 T3SS effector HopA1 family protein [Bombilactobacillus thymidiniphilus]